MFQPGDHAATSIIIPVYNRTDYLLKAIQTVQSQTLENWEVIVIDDGSTEDVVNRVTQLKDSRIRVILLPHCGNIALLRNTGVRASWGKWIAFLDADDEWFPGKLAIQIQWLEGQDKRWGYCNYELIDRDSRTISLAKNGSSLSGWITRQILTCEVSLCTSSLIVERSLFEQTGGFDTHSRLILREDYEWVLRTSLYAECLSIPYLLVRVREHEGRTTNMSKDGYRRTAFVYRHFMKRVNDKELKKVAKKRMAHHYAEWSRVKMQEGKFHSAMLLLAKALVCNDRVKHVLSSFWGGLSGDRLQIGLTGLVKIKKQ